MVTEHGRRIASNLTETGRRVASSLSEDGRWGSGTGYIAYISVGGAVGGGSSAVGIGRSYASIGGSIAGGASAYHIEAYMLSLGGSVARGAAVQVGAMLDIDQSITTTITDVTLHTDIVRV